jgi:aminopeptidase
MNGPEFDRMLRKYADVILSVGVNLQRGQRLDLRTDVQDKELARQLAIRAYEMGASLVDVLWVDETLDRIRFDYANPETLTVVPDWIIKRHQEHGDRGDAYVIIFSKDPDLLHGVNPEHIATYRQSLLQRLEPTFKYIDNSLINWNAVSTSTPAWAKKVFPELPSEQAQEKLWEAIFKACRIDQEDPVQAWKEHKDQLQKRCEYMNSRSYTELHYRAPGTDLTVGLPHNHLWIGGSTKTPAGIEFIPNMPTEEVFTIPHKDKVNGTVSSSRPLNELSILIDKFTLTFENGRVTKAIADVGEEHLVRLLDTDQYARQLGEVALVPHSSPISQQGHLFYNTLFDENASSHLALGAAYRFTMEGATEMTKEEFMANGGNDSLIHTDFMIGSGDMDIDGICADGTREPVMRSGEWAFDV